MQPRQADRAKGNPPNIAGRPPEAVRVRLLGGFSVSVGARSVEEGRWRSRKAAALVKLLALEAGHRVHRDRAMQLLWPELDVKAAANNLRGALYAARRVLEVGPFAASCYLPYEDDMLALCPRGSLWVDVEAFEDAAASARRMGNPEAYRAAIGLYAGDLLPEDLYEAWAEGRREDLRREHLALLVEAAALHEEREEYGSAAEALRRALANEPAHEGAGAGLVRLYALSGDRKGALRQYERLREALERELGAEPAAETTRLREEIAAGRFPPARPHRGQTHPGKDPQQGLDRRHNLPPALTSFVGRERELVEVGRALAMTRLLTLTGVGGSGKTRLALEAARDLALTYPDGAWLVDLAGLSKEGPVAEQAAEALGVREQPGRAPTDALAEALREKEALLVLDNCEENQIPPRRVLPGARRRGGGGV